MIHLQIGDRVEALGGDVYGCNDIFGDAVVGCRGVITGVSAPWVRTRPVTVKLDSYKYGMNFDPQNIRKRSLLELIAETAL